MIIARKTEALTNDWLLLKTVTSVALLHSKLLSYKPTAGRQVPIRVRL